jgi:hypothetical protein
MGAAAHPKPRGRLLLPAERVSCPPSSPCTAAGYYETSAAGFKTVAERR